MTGPGGRKRRVVIIGAGISGLMAARHLSDGGVDAIVLEKSGGVGGRMATRRLAEMNFDHGAQFFHATHPVFRNHVDRWADQGILTPWQPHPVLSGNGQTRNDTEAWFGSLGMTTLPKYIARDLDVRLNEAVVRIAMRPGGWRIWTEAANVYEADGLIITTPVPQALILLEHVPDLHGDLIERLRSVEYQPLFTLLLQLNGKSGIGERRALELEDETVGWLLDNSHKQPAYKNGSAITALATPSFSSEHTHDKPDCVRDAMMDVIRPHLATEPVQAVIHRWRYAWPNRPLEIPEATLTPAPLLLSGDGYGGENTVGFLVEASALSGLSAAATMYELLAS